MSKQAAGRKEREGTDNTHTHTERELSSHMSQEKIRGLDGREGEGRVGG